MTLEPHHRMARHLSDDEQERLDEDWRRQVLARLRPAVSPEVEARAAATADHFRQDQP